jgi:hypothetical protein
VNVGQFARWWAAIAPMTGWSRLRPVIAACDTHRMPNLSVPVGLALIFPVTVSGDNGATATAATNLESNIRVRMNPNNNRELGVLGLVATTGAEVNVSCAGFLHSFQVDVTAAATPTGISIGDPAGPMPPPEWLSAP